MRVYDVPPDTQYVQGVLGMEYGHHGAQKSAAKSFLSMSIQNFLYLSSHSLISKIWIQTESKARDLWDFKQALHLQM